MDNIIQQLKDNEKPFGLMSEEMQNKMRGIGKGRDLEVYQFSAGGFVRMTGVSCGTFIGDNTFRLRPDYEDELPAEMTISRVVLEAIIEIAQKALDK